jgi:glycosyltransferase involved in cell wall biosynthesis
MGDATGSSSVLAFGRRRPRVVVIYHFYPHYRRPIVEALSQSSSADFTFVGDDHEYLHSIAAATLDDSVRFHLAPTHHLFGPFMWQWGAVRWAIRREFDTVIMHSVPHWPCTWLGALAARMLGKRVIFWGHGYLYEPRGIKGLIRRLFHALPHAHLFYGQRSREIALRHGWRAEDLFVVSNSLDVAAQRRLRATITEDDSRQLRQRLFGDPDTPIAVCTTRLISLRRIDLLIEAIGDLRQRGHRVNLILLGDGPERERLHQLAKQLDVPVHFEGETYDEGRIARLVSASTVTVAPGKVGLTAMHSMAYGVPVISHGDADDQMPEWEAIRPGRTGDHFERGNAASLAECIRRWTTTSFPSAEVRAACMNEIETRWTPEQQREIIEASVLDCRER